MVVAAVVICLLFCLVSADDLPPEVLFKNTAEYETSLTAEDFRLGSLVVENEPHEGILQAAGKFEGDIDGPRLSYQRTDLYRNAIRPEQYKWPNRKVPYTVSSRYSTYSRARIAAAMEEYTKKTCLTFAPRADEVDYIHIMPDKGCYSMVGRVGGRQVISLGYGCIHKGIIIHELMHAVGFYHEQSRADRDTFVEVVWRNIQPGMEGQFSKYTLAQIQYLGAEYDYGSIMHYGPRDFSVNGLSTLVPLEAGVEIGQRKGFSPIDIRKVRRLYQCDQTATTRPPPPAETSAPPTTSAPDETTGCKNLRDDCKTLSDHKYCEYAKKWMKSVCSLACGFCTPEISGCDDKHPYCHAWAEKEYCQHKDYKLFLKMKCEKSCGYCY